MEALKGDISLEKFKVMLGSFSEYQKKLLREYVDIYQRFRRSGNQSDLKQLGHKEKMILETGLPEAFIITINLSLLTPQLKQNQARIEALKEAINAAKG